MKATGRVALDPEAACACVYMCAPHLWCLYSFFFKLTPSFLIAQAAAPVLRKVSGDGKPQKAGRQAPGDKGYCFLTSATVAEPFLVLTGHGPSREGLAVSWTGWQRVPGKGFPVPQVSVPCPDPPARCGVPGCFLKGETSQCLRVPWSREALGQTALFRGLYRVGRVGQPACAPHGRVVRGSATVLSPGRPDKRPAGAVGRDEAMQAGCQPPSRVCQTLILVRTCTLHADRWELVCSGLLIASPTAPAASHKLLHEASGVGAPGMSRPGPAPRQAHVPLAKAALLAEAFGIPYGECRVWRS